MNLRKNHLSNLAPIINTISIGDIYLNNVWEENKYDMFQKKSTSTSEYYGQRQQTDARPAWSRDSEASSQFQAKPEPTTSVHSARGCFRPSASAQNPIHTLELGQANQTLGHPRHASRAWHPWADRVAVGSPDPELGFRRPRRHRHGVGQRVRRRRQRRRRRGGGGGAGRRGWR